MKQRTLTWRFAIAHLLGKLNYVADATSRHPSASSSDEPEDSQERMMMALIHNEAAQIGIILWAHLVQETLEDTAFTHLLGMVDRGELDSHPEDPKLSAFWPIRHSIYIDHGVLMYQDRVVVPPTLCPQILQHLHVAHQGSSTMEQRARKIVYWPGMSCDIRATRDTCADCNRNTP